MHSVNKRHHAALRLILDGRNYPAQGSSVRSLPGSRLGPSESPSQEVSTGGAADCATCSFYRRLLLIFLVALTLYLTGCATTRPIADRGTVLVTWEVNPARVPGNHCGYAEQIAEGHWLVTFRRAYDFTNPCWAHELAHAFGASHAQ